MKHSVTQKEQKESSRQSRGRGREREREREREKEKREGERRERSADQQLKTELFVKDRIQNYCQPHCGSVSGFNLTTNVAQDRPYAHYSHMIGRETRRGFFLCFICTLNDLIVTQHRHMGVCWMT